MMALADDLESDVDNIITTPWKTREGRKVPDTEDVALAGGAVELDAVFLYGDLAHSSRMAKEFDRRVAAKIFKSFLATIARLVRYHDGSIVSFDGDRILGVFVGSAKNSTAAKCALQINYTVKKIIRAKFESKYDAVSKASFRIHHGAGLDGGTALAVRAGARGANDLIWIGRAPNLAAKLSDMRKPPHHTYITSAVYNRLNDGSKYGPKGQDIWERRSWEFLGDTLRVYRSNWHWKP